MAENVAEWPMCGCRVAGGSLLERVGLMQPLLSVPNNFQVSSPATHLQREKTPPPSIPLPHPLLGVKENLVELRSDDLATFGMKFRFIQECWAVAAHAADFRAHGRVIRTHTAYYAAHGTPYRARIRNLHHHLH